MCAFFDSLARDFRGWERERVWSTNHWVLTAVSGSGGRREGVPAAAPTGAVRAPVSPRAGAAQVAAPPMATPSPGPRCGRGPGRLGVLGCRVRWVGAVGVVGVGVRCTGIERRWVAGWRAPGRAGGGCRVLLPRRVVRRRVVRRRVRRGRLLAPAGGRRWPLPSTPPPGAGPTPGAGAAGDVGAASMGGARSGW
ncbi:DUF6228 family protein [Streptomyces flaveolus]|uniref:DUF6228 family protein n=1 Tax=Streptomyces flaveolus TaxID=67297 RepID=UPI0033B1689F